MRGGTSSPMKVKAIRANVAYVNAVAPLGITMLAVIAESKPTIGIFEGIRCRANSWRIQIALLKSAHTAANVNTGMNRHH